MNYRLLINKQADNRFNWGYSEYLELKTSQDVCNALGLNTWKAVKEHNHDEFKEPIKGSYMIRRINDVPGTDLDREPLCKLVNDKYTVLQFPKGLSYADSYLMEGLLSIDSAFYVDPGTQVCLTMTSNIDAEVVAGDTVRRYLILALSHTTKKGVFGYTDICPVCENTLEAATIEALSKAGKGLEINQSNPEKSLEYAKRLLNLTEQRFYTETLPTYRAYSALELEDSQQEYIIRTIINAPLETVPYKFSETVLTHYTGIKKALKESPGQDMRGENNGYALLSAVSNYSQKIGRTDYERHYGEKFGDGRRMRNQTMQLLRNLLPKSAIPVAAGK